ncbi:MAG TPA: amino acid deaminase/aldolase [Thermoleophilaceae bacterium]|nr:amino acid deaminase/aldolase [Thermoleophilaceae bacterium]
MAGRSWEQYQAAFEGLDAPFAFVDLDAMWSNAREMLGRAAGKPIRVASKSVRCRPLLRAILDRDERFAGLLTFTLAESLWLHSQGFEDLMCAYPTADRGALAELGRLESDRPPIVMVDSTAHLDFIDAAAGAGHRPIRVCIEIDLGYWIAGGRIKIGAKRSPIRTPQQAAALADHVHGRPSLELAGIMGYESHIAGVGDPPLGKRLQGPAIRLIKRRSAREIAERRAAIVAAVREATSLQLVNGGGTGSLHTTAQEEAVTELAAGSGFYAPTLFDRYADFTLTPAAAFALPVVRKPATRVATLLGGGYLASGPAGKDRLPEPWLPSGLRFDPLEGAGEVQTPVLGAAAAGLKLGDKVYLRHAKAGELCERFDRLLLVEGGEVVNEIPTYRGEGRCFV